MRGYIEECFGEYGMDKEQSRDYGPGWTEWTSQNETAPEGYRYVDSDELDGWPFWGGHEIYSGGGYVIELKGSVRELKQKLKRYQDELWVDRYTRAIFIEFTVYNPYVNLFGVVTMIAEFIPSTGMHPFIRVDPVNLLGYVSNARLFQYICQGTYLCFILFFIIKEFRKLLRHGKKYFREPWNYIEVAIIVLSIGATVIYFYRLLVTQEKTTLFKETHGNGYMKFQYVAYWNELLLYLVGWLVFLATVKFIRLLRFNRRMSILAQTLRIGAKPLLMFGIVFAIFFMAYAQFFYMIYFIELYNFSNIIYSAETCLQMLVGKFNFNAMKFASPVLGPLVFFCYVVTVYYILINMFLTILNESFAAVRRDIEKQSNEYEMVEFISKRFAQWTGLSGLFGKKKDDDDLDDKKKKKKGKENQIDQFPETMERFMDCISKVYFDQDTFEALFYSAHKGKDKDTMKAMMKTGKGRGGDPSGATGSSGMPAVDHW